MELVPITQAEAKEFVTRLHRHNRAPVGSVCQVGVQVGDELVGVAIAGRPVARMLQDGYTLEVIRTCTDGTPNANSMLYGAIARAAKALGYRRLITYTSGFVRNGEDASNGTQNASGFVRNGEDASNGTQNALDENLLMVVKESAPAITTRQGRTTVVHDDEDGSYLTRLVRQISVKALLQPWTGNP